MTKSNRDPPAFVAEGDRQQLPALRRLSRLGFSSLLHLGEHKICPANAICLRQGDPAERFCLVSHGCLKAQLSMASGRSLILGLHGAGDSVGLGEMLGKRTYHTSAIAVAESGCLVISRMALLELFSTQPEVLVEVLPLLARNLVGCSNCLAESGCLKVETRLARLFLRLSNNGTRADRDGTWIPLHLSREELAELTATTLESCSRVMSSWSRQGIVFTSDGGFLVPKREELARLAAA